MHTYCQDCSIVDYPNRTHAQHVRVRQPVSPQANRLGLPFIPLKENTIFQQKVHKPKKRLDYHGLKEMERKVVH